jgi:hypothetical protein
VKHWASVYLGKAGLLLPSAEQQVIDFLPSVGNLALALFNRHSEECWVSVHIGRLASWQIMQSSRLPLNGGAWDPTLRQWKLDSPVGRQGVKCWASVHIGEAGLLVLSTD